MARWRSGCVGMRDDLSHAREHGALAFGLRGHADDPSHTREHGAMAL